MAEYDLCIVSVPGDKGRAKELADSLLQYRLPKSAAGQDRDGVRSIAADDSGSAFDEKAKALLDSSRNIAIICSPATRCHRGICDRLEYFRRERGDSHIIGVLTEGEPSDSFPENFIRTVILKQEMPDGSVEEREDTIEPVAADLRGDTPGRRKELLKYETVRITASVLGIHPDVLEQRHRRRRMRTLIAVASVVGAVCLAASAIFLRLGIIAKNEGDLAEQQTRLSLKIARRTINELPEQFKDDPEALAYISETIADVRGVIREQGLEDMFAEAPEGNGD